MQFQRRPPPSALVKVRLWGADLVMRADHRLPEIMRGCPRFSEPIGLLAQAIPRQVVRVIDVGANIGDTVALVEHFVPGKCRYLCIEMDPDFVELCRVNTAGIDGVEVVRAAIDDSPPRHLSSAYHAAGTAAPVAHEGGLLSASLDAVAGDFVRGRGGLEIIKVDTDGFDAKVLRSGKALIRQYHPAILFELHPFLWHQAGEVPTDVFGFLRSSGYTHFVFFSNRGNLLAQADQPSELLLETLVRVSLSRREIDDFHFDVLAADAETCAAVVERSLQRNVTMRSL